LKGSILQSNVSSSLLNQKKVNFFFLDLLRKKFLKNHQSVTFLERIFEPLRSMIGKWTVSKKMTKKKNQNYSTQKIFQCFFLPCPKIFKVLFPTEQRII